MVRPYGLDVSAIVVRTDLVPSGLLDWHALLLGGYVSSRSLHSSLKLSLSRTHPTSSCNLFLKALQRRYWNTGAWRADPDLRADLRRGLLGPAYSYNKTDL